MRNFFKKIIEIFFPNQCLLCSELIGQEGAFCRSCWSKLQFITEPKCNICSHPFEYLIAENLLCPKCLVQKPSYDKAIVVFRYNTVIKKVIADFKYRDTTYLSKKFAKILFDRYKNEIGACDFIVAVPLHKKRLRKRKFNQAVILGRDLAKLSEKRFFYDLLLRIKNTTPQVELRKKQRQKNLKNAFRLNEKYSSNIIGKKILLIDDVTTTGTTLENCAEILKKFGAAKVVTLTIAKTIYR